MKTKKHSAGYYIGFLIFIIVALINIYPMVFSIFCSFKGNLEIFSSFTALPKKLRIENYLTAWNVGNIGRYFFEYNYSCSWNSCDIRSFLEQWHRMFWQNLSFAENQKYIYCLFQE